MERKYPLKRERRDLRDYHFRSAAYRSAEELPKAVDLRDGLSPVMDQGALGSCTANAIVSGLREYLLLENGGKWEPLSRLYLYWHERQLEGHVDTDSGAYIRDGMKVLQKHGVCPERDYPYQVDRFRDTPSGKAEEDARPYAISEYHRIPDLDGLKAALAEGMPVVFGMAVYESFESQAVAESGKVPYPKKKSERMLGGHAMTAVGYRDRGQSGAVIVRNSWGTGWGDEGYCYIPYRIFRDPELVMDMWTGR